MTQLLRFLAGCEGYEDGKAMLMDYYEQGLSIERTAKKLGVGINTVSRWKRQNEIPALERWAGWVPKVREYKLNLFREIQNHGLDRVKNMTACEISDEFGVCERHVRWAAKRYGFEYRHVKTGRRRKCNTSL